MLAQQMIRIDMPSAIYRLGVSKAIADMLVQLSNAQLIKLASSSVMLTRFRFDDTAILGKIGPAHGDQTIPNERPVMSPGKKSLPLLLFTPKIFPNFVTKISNLL